MSLLLDNYSLTLFQMLRSVIVSEYGLRHLAKAAIEPQSKYKWGHKFIALIELTPVIGLIVSIFEFALYQFSQYLIVKNFLPHYHNILQILGKPTQQNPLILFPPFNENLFSSLSLNFFEKLPKHLPHWKTSILFYATQNGCDGKVPVSKVNSLCAQLELQSPLGIHFNPKKITSSLEGGTCSAMSLEFLEDYFKAKKLLLEKKSDLNQLVNVIQKVAKKYAKSSEEMRIIQTAYNTIEIEKLEVPVDYSKNKVQSLANHHSLVIDYSSNEIEVGSENKDQLFQEMNTLPDGGFLIRFLKPENNDKLEKYGHSLVYIKEKNLGLFYDPNLGVFKLSSDEHQTIVSKILQYCWKINQVTKARFYRMQPL